MFDLNDISGVLKAQTLITSGIITVNIWWFMPFFSFIEIIMFKMGFLIQFLVLLVSFLNLYSLLQWFHVRISLIFKTNRKKLQTKHWLINKRNLRWKANSLVFDIFWPKIYILAQNQTILQIDKSRIFLSSIKSKRIPLFHHPFSIS